MKTINFYRFAAFCALVMSAQAYAQSIGGAPIVPITPGGVAQFPIPTGVGQIPIPNGNSGGPQFLIPGGMQYPVLAGGIVQFPIPTGIWPFSLLLPSKP